MAATSSRILLLLSLLQARRDWPGLLLAERLEVSGRTVRRDVDRLRGLGYRIRAIKGPDGGYRLDAGSELPPLLFDDDQTVALAVALQLATASGASIGEAALRALATVRQLMPARLRHRVDAVTITTVPVPTAAVADVAPELLLVISDAVRAKQSLRFDYASAHDPVDPATRRHVEPHHVVARNGRWYLIAWDLDRDDWRVFRLDRVTPRLPHGSRFTPRDLPGGEVGSFLSARFKGSETADVWPCVGEVEVALPASVVIPFSVDGIVEAIGPQRCRLVSGSWSWVALAASLGRFDADIVVVSPPALADAFEVLARRYANTGSQPLPAQSNGYPTKVELRHD